MRFIYVSRAFNRIGYSILKHLLSHGIYKPAAVVLSESPLSKLLDEPASASKEIERYIDEANFMGCRPIRFHGSISRLAHRFGIPVFYRKTLKDDTALAWLQSLAPDLIVLGGGWPELLPKCVIDMPRLGIINTHPSLLPDFRGTDIHRWQIYHGVSRSGTTIHYVDQVFDTGDILGKAETEISDTDTPQALADKAGVVAGPLISDVLGKIVASAPHKLLGEAQCGREDDSRYYSRWRWEDRGFLRLDWTSSAVKLQCFVLACTQESFRYNGPFFILRDQEYILREARVVPHDGTGKPGQVVWVDDDGIIVRCSDSDVALSMILIQPVSRKDWSPPSHNEPARSARTYVSNGAIVIGDDLIVSD